MEFFIISNCPKQGLGFYLNTALLSTLFFKKDGFFLFCFLTSAFRGRKNVGFFGVFVKNSMG